LLPIAIPALRDFAVAPGELSRAIAPRNKPRKGKAHEGLNPFLALDRRCEPLSALQRRKSCGKPRAKMAEFSSITDEKSGLKEVTHFVKWGDRRAPL